MTHLPVSKQGGSFVQCSPCHPCKGKGTAFVPDLDAAHTVAHWKPADEDLATKHLLPLSRTFSSSHTSPELNSNEASTQALFNSVVVNTGTVAQLGISYTTNPKLKDSG